MLQDQWRLSLRGEYFDDSDGYKTGVIQEVEGSDADPRLPAVKVR